MRNGQDGVGDVLFGAKQQVDVDRALAEFKAGRPIRVAGDGEEVITLPVEGLTDERLAAFRTFCGASPIRLIITGKRARALGLVEAGTTEALALPLSDGASAHGLLAIVADAWAEGVRQPESAGPAASAAVELAKVAQLLPAVLAADCRVHPSARPTELVTVAANAVRGFHEEVLRSLTIAGEARVPLATAAKTRFVVFRDALGSNPVAVIIGDPDFSTAVPVRMHSACLTGDVFGSRRCDCGDQLKLAITQIDAAGGGVVLYLAQEGRGLGLVNKMRAYRLQDGGLDTIDANTTLGFNDDERDYSVAARMLEMLGIDRVRLLTNNPAKVDGLTCAGIKIASRMPIEAPVNSDNRRYLTAKAARAGHHLDHLFAALGGATEVERVRGNGHAAPAEAERTTIAGA